MSSLAFAVEAVMLALPCLSRCLALHPSKPLLVSASDDGLIKLWNWDKVRRLSAALKGIRAAANVLLVCVTSLEMSETLRDGHDLVNVLLAVKLRCRFDRAGRTSRRSRATRRRSRRWCSTLPTTTRSPAPPLTTPSRCASAGVDVCMSQQPTVQWHMAELGQAQ